MYPESNPGREGRFLLLAIFAMVTSGILHAQTVNTRLYLKSGNTLNRTVPVSATPVTSVALTKSEAAFAATTSGSYSGNGGTSPLVFSHTPGTGSNRLLIVGVSFDPASTAAPVSSVTFGGTPLTLWGSAINTGNNVVQLWYLVNPGSTAANIQINYGSGNLQIASIAMTVNNVDQAFPLRTPATNVSGTGNSTVNVTSQAGDIIYDLFSTDRKSPAPTNSTDQTPNNTVQTNKLFIGSSRRAALAGTTPMTWTASTGNSSHIGVALRGISNNTQSFILSPAACSGFTIKGGQNITITTHARVASGTATGTTLPVIARLLRSNGHVLFSAAAATNAGLGATNTTGTLTWTGTIPSDSTIAAGETLTLQIVSDYAPAAINLLYDGTANSSFVQLPTDTYVNVNSFSAFNGIAPGGTSITQRAVGVTNYLRAVVSNPFGFSDVTGVNFQIAGPSGTNTVPGTQVSASGCTATYELAWTPTVGGSYSISAIARQGTEGTVSHSRALASTFNVVPPSLSVAKTITSAAPFVLNQNIQFNIAVTNTGLSSLSQIPLQDIFSTSCYEFVSASITPASVVNGVATWQNIASSPLAPNGVLNITVTLRLIGTCAPANNTARVENARDNLNFAAATVSSTIGATVSAPPVAVPDAFCVQGAGPVNVLANDTDANIAGFINSVSGQYTVTIQGGLSAGSALVNPDRTIQFNPSGMNENQVSVFTYRVTEVATGLFSEATVAVRYSVLNNAPLAQADTRNTTINFPINIDVLQNDSDADGTLQAPAISVNPLFGRVVVNPDRTITYTPNNGFTGTDVFTYQVCDNGCPLPSQCATALVTVNVVNAVYVCKESTSTLSVNAVSDAMQYIWTLPAGAVVTSSFTTVSGKPATTTPSITVNWNGVAAGQYDVCAQVLNECGPGQEECTRLVVTQLEAAFAPVNVSCFGGNNGSVNLTVSGGIAPFGYLWSGPNGYTATIEDISGLRPGSYAVSVTDANGCTVSGNTNITAPASSVSVSGSITNESSPGALNGSINITPAGGTSPYSFLWSNGSLAEDISNLGAGTYSVTVTDANGCTTTGAYTINRTGGALEITLLAKTDVLCFNGTTGTVNLEVIGGSGSYSYTWSASNGGQVPSGQANLQDLSNLRAGTYTVIVNDGISTVQQSVTVVQPAAALTAGVSGTNISCAGGANGTISLNVNGGTAPYTFLWNNGAVTQNLTGLSAGTYSVTVRDANGCSTTAQTTLTQPSVLSLGATQVNTQCTAAGTGSIAVTPSGGTPGYTYLWSNGATSASVSGLTAGPYAVTVTDAAGCSISRAFTISNACLGVAKSISAAALNNGNGTYTLTYSIKVENKGNVVLQNVQVADNLSAAFNGASSFVVNSISSGDFTVNTGFNGTDNLNLLAGPLPSLGINGAGFIQLTVTVTPGTKLGIYHNSATATAMDAGGKAVSDVSQNGTITDPDNDGNPGNNSDPTPVTFSENPAIGIAKSISSSPVNNGSGTFSMAYTLTVRNYGDVPLSSLQVTDNLDNAFGAGLYAVTGVTADAGFTANWPGYNGSTNPNLLLASSPLAINEIRTITIQVAVTPQTAGPFNNTAEATAVSPSGAVVADQSQTGSNPDPDGDNNPGNNNTPTPVAFTENPVIGIAKRVAGTPVNNNDGSYTVPYELKISNRGNSALSQVQITDDLAAAFPGKVFSVSGLTSAAFTVNSAYNGNTNIGLLAAGNTLAVGETQLLSFNVRVTPGTFLGAYNNTATVSATSTFGTAISDVSNDGVEVDPENDGPGNNSIPTPVLFTESPLVGLSKTVNTPVNNGNGTYSLTYTLRVVNMGNVPVSGVQVVDNLAATFSGASAFTVTGITASGTLSANNAFTGVAPNTNVLIAGSSSLAVGAEAEITITVAVTPGAKLGIYNNSATLRAVSAGGSIIADVSANGTNVDPDNDGNPGNNSVPTPIGFSEAPLIGTAKRVVGTPVNNGDGTYTVTYEIRVENAGNIRLNNVQLVDDLRAAFPVPTILNVTGKTIITQPVSSLLTINNGYNGTTDVNLLSGTGSLAIGEHAVMQVTVVVNPAGLGGPFNNTATAIGTSPAARVVLDNSQDGTAVDPDNNNNPNDNNEPTPVVFFSNPKAGISKELISVINNGNGTNTVTMELRVKNYGDGRLNDLAITDDVLTQFASMTPASFVAIDGTDKVDPGNELIIVSKGLFANPAWNGNAITNVLEPGQYLEIGEEGNVRISFVVTLNGDLRTLFNSATASATSATGTPASDVSQNGNNPDPDNDNDPSNNNAPTPVPFSCVSECITFRTVRDGNWNDAGVWERQLCDGSWIAAAATPLSGNAVIIRHVISQNVDFTVAECPLTMEANGVSKLFIEPDITLSFGGGKDGNAYFNQRSVVVRSTAAGTGAIGAMTPDSKTWGDGNVTLERYIPGTKRRWNLLTLGVSNSSVWPNSTIRDGWGGGERTRVSFSSNRKAGIPLGTPPPGWWGDRKPNNVPSPIPTDYVPGDGTIITGHRHTNSGIANAQGYDWWPELIIPKDSIFYVTPTQISTAKNDRTTPASIRPYKPNASSDFGPERGSQWVSNGLINNTGDGRSLVQLKFDEADQGYMLFTRGDRMVLENWFGETTLRPTGQIRTLNVPVLLFEKNKQLTVVGNPYPAPVSLEKLYLHNMDHMEPKAYVWNSAIEGGNNLGGWVSLTRIGENSWVASPAVSGDHPELISSSQAFKVEGKGETPVLTFKEEMKANIRQVDFLPFEQQGDAAERPGVLQINLNRRSSSGDPLRVLDGVGILLHRKYSADATDVNDVMKLYPFEGGTTLSLKHADTALTFEAHPLPQGTKVFPLTLAGMGLQPYAFTFKVQDLQRDGLEVYLRDKFLGTETPVSTISETTINFEGTADGNSRTPDRFDIVFRQGSVLPVQFTSITAEEKQQDVRVSWSVATEDRMSHYDVEHSRNGTEFGKAVKVEAKNTSPASYEWLHVQPGAGTHYYRVRAYNVDGRSITTRIVKVDIGVGKPGFKVFPTIVSDSRTVTVQMTAMAKGRYTLQVTDMAGRVISARTIDHNGGSASLILQLPPALGNGKYNVRLQGNGSNYVEGILKD